jgi:hypothetical protein
MSSDLSSSSYKYYNILYQSPHLHPKLHRTYLTNIEHDTPFEGHSPDKHHVRRADPAIRHLARRNIKSFNADYAVPIVPRVPRPRGSN